MIDKIAIGLLFLLTARAYGYVEAKTTSGLTIWWPSSTKQIYLHPDNNNGLDENDLIGIIAQSVSEWTSNDLGFGVNLQVSQDSVSSYRNDIYFSESTGYFGGSGVVAVTQTAYRETTGEIVEADIIINDEHFFLDSSAEKLFLGNVITHELGHFFGLSHSEVKSSSMFYALMKDQWSVSSDDAAGALSIYRPRAGGSISGRIIGGNEAAIGIFGAHVLAISAKDGSVVGAISNADGTFLVDGLDLSNSYYLQVRPLTTLDVIPDYYATVRNNFCYGDRDYTTHFFERCETRYYGHPQEIGLTVLNPSVSVGDVTIGCSLDSPVEYLSNFELSLDVDNKSFVGYVAGENDEAYINIDLSNYNTSSSNEYLIINLLTQRLYSAVKAKLEVYKGGVLLETVESGSDLNLDLIAKISLATYGVGLYELKVTIENIISSAGIYSGGNTIEDYFPEGSNYVDGYAYYFLNYSIGTKNGTEYLLNSPSSSVQSNSTCFEGSNAYSISPKVESLEADSEDDVDPGFTCATISSASPPDGGVGGIMSVFLGLLFVFASKRLTSIGAHVRRT